MNKAILTIDVPSSCDGCPLFGSHYSDMTCKANGRGIDYPYPKEVRQEWCPLKPNNGWISVEDALPKESMPVLVTTRTEMIWTAFYDRTHGTWVDDVRGKVLNVIAWMELPAPYKKGE